MKYQTIVADPPWDYPEGFVTSKGGRWGDGTSKAVRIDLGYPALSVEEIAALRVRDAVARDCRLFLWTTSRYLPAACGIVAAWGFSYVQTLLWHKTGNPTSWGGSLAPNHAEFLLVAKRGAPPRLARLPSSVIAIDTNPARLRHSEKPEAFLDLIEQVSPGPYLELFARRQRLGWDTWGNETNAAVPIQEPLRPTRSEHSLEGAAVNGLTPVGQEGLSE